MDKLPDIKLLDDMHRLMRSAVAALQDNDLRRPRGGKHKLARLICEIASHNIYHAG